MTQPAPDIQALAETLAEARGELAEFQRERDQVGAGRAALSGVYGGHLRFAAEIAARLARRGWCLASRAEPQGSSKEGAFVAEEEAAKAAHDAEHPNPKWKAPEG